MVATAMDMVAMVDVVMIDEMTAEMIDVMTDVMTHDEMTAVTTRDAMTDVTTPVAMTHDAMTDVMTHVAMTVGSTIALHVADTKRAATKLESRVEPESPVVPLAPASHTARASVPTLARTSSRHSPCASSRG